MSIQNSIPRSPVACLSVETERFLSDRFFFGEGIKGSCKEYNDLAARVSRLEELPQLIKDLEDHPITWERIACCFGFVGAAVLIAVNVKLIFLVIGVIGLASSTQQVVYGCFLLGASSSLNALLIGTGVYWALKIKNASDLREEQERLHLTPSALLDKKREIVSRSPQNMHVLLEELQRRSQQLKTYGWKSHIPGAEQTTFCQHAQQDVQRDIQTIEKVRAEVQRLWLWSLAL